MKEPSAETAPDTSGPEIAAVHELAQPTSMEESRTAGISNVIPVEIENASVGINAPAVIVEEDDYQRTIPVRRPLEKVHDEDYQKTIALQRVREDVQQPSPADRYDANYQKTIALQRRPVDVHDEAYIKTISLQHPPASLAGASEREAIGGAASSPSSAISADLRDGERAEGRAGEQARLPIDLVQKAKWGQRALLASFALLLIVAAAYFFLRSQQTSVSASSNDTAPAQLQIEALARLPAVPVNKSIDPSPLKLSVDAAKQADKKVVVQSAPATKPLPSAKPAAAAAPAPANRQTKAAPAGEVLYLPPGATAASAAATAAAIADAIGKKPPAQPASTSAPEAAVMKGTANSGATSPPPPLPQPPAPCTDALAALGLCVNQPAPRQQ